MAEDEYNRHVGLRISDEMESDIEAISNKYEMKKSEVVRMLIRCSSTIVLEDGIDALIEVQNHSAPDRSAVIEA